MILNLFLFLCGFLSCYDIDVWMEKNVSKIPSKINYKRVDSVKISSRNKDYRFIVNVINSDNKNIETMSLRYSIKAVVERNGSIYETVSLISSSLRGVNIKSGSSKKLHIYNLRNIFSEISKYMNAGYNPVEIKIEVMKEPKKSEELSFKVFSFKVEK